MNDRKRIECFFVPYPKRFGVLTGNRRKGRHKGLSESRSKQIGRFITCDIILKSPYISNGHCAIYSNTNDVYIEDLFSTNGTKLNGKIINSSTKFQDNDLIELDTKAIIRYKKLSH
ncbi:MAG: FHA domain-containing protein [Dysgonamonadaceae bacterium]